ncbi:MAG TPA: hypothetical protein VI653_04095 [Steroidobacteraceae bacterium]
MNKIVLLPTLAVGCVLGAWWGLHQAPQGPTPDVAVRPSPEAARTANMPGPPSAIDVPTLRAILREELSVALRTKQQAGPAGAQAAEAPVSAEMVAKRREAQVDLNASIGGSVWGNEQRFEFQQKVLLLDPEQRERVMQELVTRLNSGALKVETDGPPL